MVGRVREKQQLADFLSSDKSVLFVVGIGGVGKSYLVRWLAWEGRADRPVAWVECNQRSLTVEGLVDSIATAVENASLRTLLSQRRERVPVGESWALRDCIDGCLEELDRNRCILILEDLHDLDESASARLEYNFLQQATRSLAVGKIVIASRRFPAISDEPELRSFQDRLTLLGLSREESQEFLVSRGVNLPANLVDKLWAKAGQGIPKALELATPHLKESLEPEQVIEGWRVYKEGGTEWLSAQMQDLGARTYEFLTIMSILRRPEHISFCRKLWPTEDFERRLDDLRAWCLLDPTGDPGWVLISNIFREYILGKCVEPSRRLELHDRVAQAYFSHVQDSQESGQAEWLVEAIWHASQAQNPDRVIAAAALLRQIPQFEQNLGLLGQVDHLTIDAARKTGDRSVMVDWLPRYAHRLIVSEEMQQAVDALEEAAAIARRHFAETVQLDAYRHLAEAYYTQGKYQQAQETYGLCVKLARALHDEEKELDILPELGAVQLRTHQTAEAEQTLLSCVDLARQAKNKRVEAKAQCRLARLYLKHKPHTTARENAIGLLLDAREAFTELRSQSDLAEVFGLLGDCYRYENDYCRAQDYYHRAREIERRLGQRAHEAITIGQLAFLARDQGDFKEALDLCDESLTLSRRLGNAVGEQINMVLRAELLLAMGQREQAYREIIAARKLASDPVQRQAIGIASADRALARYYRETGDSAAAKDAIDSALGQYVATQSFQYAQEAWRLAISIYNDWTSRYEPEKVYQELKRIAFDEAEPYRLERVALLAELWLSKQMPDETGRLSDDMLGLCETLDLLDYAREKWVPIVVQHCLEEWFCLLPRVFRAVIPLTDAAQRVELYRCWVEASIREGDAKSRSVVFEAVQNEPRFSFETRFNLLEPLEVEADPSERKQLADAYADGLMKEVDQALRARRPLQPYAHDVRRALAFLDREQSNFLEDYIQTELDQYMSRSLLAHGFSLTGEQPRLDIRGKRVAVLGGEAQVRRRAAEEARNRFGLDQIREVPPSWESHVHRDVVHSAIREADLVVHVWRHMGHDLDDCLKAALAEESATDRVRYSPGSGFSSIVRTIQDYFQEKQAIS